MTDTLDLGNLSSTSGSLDVLKVYFGVLTEADDGAEAVVQALKALELLEHLDELDGFENVGVLRRDLDGNLELGANLTFIISCKHANDCSAVKRLK